MPVVVTCPACQQKAKVPEAMLGQTVKCPACAATLPVPAEKSPPAEPPPIPAPTDPADRPPLPADADALRSVRSGAGVQLVAHCLYAAALALFVLMLLSVLVGQVTAGGGFGRRYAFGSSVALLLTVGANVLLLVANLMNTVGAALCVPAPVAQRARGLAIALLFLALVGFHRLIETFGWVTMMFEDASGRFNVGTRYWMAGIVFFWLIEVVRLSVLALFWRAMSRVLRDARGSALARRLAIFGPVVQVFVVVVWCLIGAVGATGPEIEGLAYVSWIAVQFLVVMAGIGVVARLRRRLKAAVPDGA